MVTACFPFIKHDCDVKPFVRQQFVFLTILYITFLVLIIGCVTLQSTSDYYSAYEELAESEDWTSAEELLKKAVKEYPREITFHTLLNYCLRNQQKYSQSVAQIEVVYDKFPDEESVIDSYKWSLQQLGWEEAAEQSNETAFELFEQAYRLEPDDEWSINAYGYILRENGRITESIDILQHGHEQYPDNEYIQTNLVLAYITAGNEHRDTDSKTQAEEYFLQAQEIDPENEWLLLNYGVLLQKTEKWSESLKMLTKGAALYPENEYFEPNIIATYYDYGRMTAESGDIEKAISVFSEARDRFPNEVWFYTYLSEYAQQKGNMRAAGRYLFELAALKDRLNILERDGINLEVTIYNRLVGLSHKFAAKDDYDTAFAILGDLDRYFVNKALLQHLNGVLTFHAGKPALGMNLVYAAYDEYLLQHPENRISLTVNLPVRGTYVVGGNDSHEAITHAGFNRFCYDFIGSTEDGKIRYPDANSNTVSSGFGKNEDYIGFGKPVYSPIDGTVELVVDDKPDLPPSDSYRLLDGNIVSVKDTHGRHYVLIHTRKGSARVSVGNQVKAGQMIAEIGNSGMTTVPHLHFGVYSADWVVSLPVRFKTYVVIKNEGPKLTVTEGVPSTNEIIADR